MMKRKSFVLMATVFLTLIMGIIISLTMYRSTLELRAVNVRRASAEALFAAQAGIERAIFELRRDIGWRTGFGNQTAPVDLEWPATGEVIGRYWMDGNASTDVVDGAPAMSNWATVWVRCWGEDSRGTVTRAVRARVATLNAAEHFTYTVGDLRLVSGTYVNGDVFGREVFFDVDASEPNEPDRRIDVDGDAIYVDDIENDDHTDVHITGSTVQFPFAMFSALDLEWYRQLAQAGGLYVNGDFTYSGDITRADIGAGTNPILFAEGDVHISGEVKESFVVVAGGDVYVEGNVECRGSNQIGLFAGDDVIIPPGAPDDLDIEAFIIADGGVFKAEGTTGKNNLVINGAISVRGKATERSAIMLDIYNSRTYRHDNNLVTNRNIPYMPFLVNILRWEEAPPGEPLPPGY